jgi:HAD superfamily hydrolase (TIGR01509 family)
MVNKGIVFDFDGVILETEGPIFQSWQEVFANFGFPLPFEVWASTIGTADAEFQPASALEKLVGRALDWTQLEPARHAREMALIEAQPLLPGVEQVLADARRLKLKLGVASSSSRRWVEGHLRRRGLLDYFQAVRTSDDVRLTKPHPELYQAVLAALDVPARQALAVEDSTHGIRAAKAAGLRCVAVPNDLTRDLLLDEADLQLASLAEMPLQALLKLF